MATSAYASAAHLSGKQLRKQIPLVDRFLVREHRLQAEIASMGFSTREINAEVFNDRNKIAVNPYSFLHYRSKTTGTNFSPRLSLRRQAQLGKQAYAQGRFEELIEQVDKFNFGNQELAGVKLNKMRERIQELQEEEQKQIERALPGEPEDVSVIQAVNQQIPKQTPDQVKRLAKALALTRGPYKGRSEERIFKGTIHARKAPQKRQNIIDRLSKMDQTVTDWRKQRKDAKTKSKPKLPF